MRQHCCGKPFDLCYIIFQFFSISINDGKKNNRPLGVFLYTTEICYFKIYAFSCNFVVQEKLYQAAAAFFPPVSNSGGEPELSLITS